ncbi:MAG: VTT domain-containing protein [Dehalococcoidales bacterium]|nr:VTT domain-containing protein [Dehalococcoidales bacterium]
MPEPNNNSEHNGNPAKNNAVWKSRFLSILSILFVVAISVCLFVFRDAIRDFQDSPSFRNIEILGYIGAFLISLVANATVVLPMPGLGILIGLGATFNPVLIALSGAFGGAIGELSGYVLGRSGRVITSENKWFKRAESWMQQKRGFLTLFLFALLPFLPLDVAGLVAGVSRYPIWKFLLACTLGKALLYSIMVYTGASLWEAFLNHFE